MNRKKYTEGLVGMFGYPVEDNPSVIIHHAGFKALQMQWRYLTIEVFPDDLEAAVQALRALNMRGINLTMPHKRTVISFLDEISPAAELIGAVNTVVNRDRNLFGENTDGKGFLRSLTEDAKVEPAGKNILIMGAGGAARAIAVEAALAGASKITILNRTPSRGEELSSLISGKTSCRSSFVHWDSPYPVSPETDIVVNATSIGFAPDSKEMPSLEYDTIGDSMIVCDVIPAADTPFLAEAKQRGSYTLDGLGMLVYQGAIGFTLWTGREAPVEIMYRALALEFSQPGESGQ